MILTGDQERDQLISNVRFRQLLTGRLIASTQHSIEEVVDISRVLHPACNDVVYQGMHRSDVLAVSIFESLIEKLWPVNRLRFLPGTS